MIIMVNKSQSLCWQTEHIYSHSVSFEHFVHSEKVVMKCFCLLFPAMLSDDNSVKLKSDCLPPVQWRKVAAHEDEKTNLVFKRYSQVSVFAMVI